VPEVLRITAEAVKRFGGEKVGIHCHNDSGLGVAVTLAGVEAGASLVQGTMNGYGERVGNANLVSILPNLALKMGLGMGCGSNLGQLRDLSLFLDELANLRPDPKAPFVGQSAFAHKGGLHANAATKVARSYEHIDPSLVGNRTRVLVSDMAGRSSLAVKAREFGVELDEKSPEIKGLIEELKDREFRGYEYEAADASFKLLVARKLGRYKEPFEVEGYRVIVERHGGEIWSEATVRLRVGGESVHTVAESSGPVGALDKALRLGLEKTFPQLRDMTLRDYKVRIIEGNKGTGSRTRVLVESGDGRSIWGTVGVSDNLIEASWEALREAVEYRLTTAPAA
jgi:2-isopropylmalate synthase